MVNRYFCPSTKSDGLSSIELNSPDTNTSATNSPALRVLYKHSQKNKSPVLRTLSEYDQESESPTLRVLSKYNQKTESPTLRVLSKYNQTNESPTLKVLPKYNQKTKSPTLRVLPKYNQKRKSPTLIALSKYNQTNESPTLRVLSKYNQKNESPTLKVLSKYDQNTEHKTFEKLSNNNPYVEADMRDPELNIQESNQKIICDECESIWSEKVCHYINKQNHCPHYKKIVGYSKSQIEWICSIMEAESINIQCAVSDIGEYKINGIGYVDGYCKENNTVYEYHGIFWHGHPSFFDKNDVNPINGIPFDKLYKKTIIRDKKIVDAGYNLVVKWE